MQFAVPVSVEMEVERVGVESAGGARVELSDAAMEAAAGEGLATELDRLHALAQRTTFAVNKLPFASPDDRKVLSVPCPMGTCV